MWQAGNVFTSLILWQDVYYACGSSQANGSCGWFTLLYQSGLSLVASVYDRTVVSQILYSNDSETLRHPAERHHRVYMHISITCPSILSSQQTMTRDFTCSVSEFTSSTGSIHRILWTNLVSQRVFPVKSGVFHVMICTSETVPVLIQYDSCQTRSILVTTGRTRVFTWIHMRTRTGGVAPIMNQYDTCQLVQKWFLVCWDKYIIYITINVMFCDIVFEVPVYLPQL